MSVMILLVLGYIQSLTVATHMPHEPLFLLPSASKFGIRLNLLHYVDMPETSSADNVGQTSRCAGNF